MTRNYLRLKEQSQLNNIPLSNSDLQSLVSLFRGRLEVSRSITDADRYHLQANQYVGTIWLPDTTIIIEPKIPIKNFVHMLATVYNLAELQDQEEQYRSIAELSLLVVKTFIESLQTLVHQGFIQGYQEVNENLVAVRGQLDLPTQLYENYANIARNRCNYADLTLDILENRLLKLALERLTGSHLITAELQALYYRAYQALSTVSLADTEDFSKLQFTRLNSHYYFPLNLAKIIVHSCSPDLLQPVPLDNDISTTGTSPTATNPTCAWPALLIDMNRLFEHYLYSQLKHSIEIINTTNATAPMPPSPYLATISLCYQTQVNFDKHGRLKMIPDFQLMIGDRPIAVLDAKYKKESVASDYYQLLAYISALNIDYGYLIYPAWEGEATQLSISNSEKVISEIMVPLDLTKTELEQEIMQIITNILSRYR